jgi:hypothetical protein
MPYCSVTYHEIILCEGGEVAALHIANRKFRKPRLRKRTLKTQMTNKLFALPALMGALFIAGTTQAYAAGDETEGTTTLSLDVNPVADITNVTALVTLTPTATDYRQNFVSQPSAITFNVFSNFGYSVKATGDETEGLKSAHIGLKRNGAADYVTLTNATPVALLSGGVSSNAGENISVDVQITLPDADDETAYSVGDTHSNDITFTVEANDD